jgi:hypothetical protein
VAVSFMAPNYPAPIMSDVSVKLWRVTSTVMIHAINDGLVIMYVGQIK